MTGTRSIEQVLQIVKTESRLRVYHERQKLFSILPITDFSWVGKSSNNLHCMAGVKAGCVRLCRVASNIVLLLLLLLLLKENDPI